MLLYYILCFYAVMCVLYGVWLSNEAGDADLRPESARLAHVPGESAQESS